MTASCVKGTTQRAVALARRHQGLLVLCRGLLSERALGGEETRDVRMGCVLWKDVASQLNELVPIDSPRRAAWVDYLSQASGVA
jgi:hypothetical protein